jgi:hypothetical protein
LEITTFFIHSSKEIFQGDDMKIIQITFMCLILVPIYAFGFEVLSDQNLDSIGGQSGIDIFLEGTTKVQVEIGDFIFGDIDGDGSGNAGYFSLDGSPDSPRTNNDKTIMYLELTDTLLKLDVGSSGTSGVIDQDSSNEIIDGTLLVNPDQSFVKVGLPPVSDIVVQFELPGKSEIKFHDESNTLSYSLGNVLMTPLTLKINKIYNDLYISSH